jgi:hypothetical protein
LAKNLADGQKYGLKTAFCPKSGICDSEGALFKPAVNNFGFQLEKM